MNRLPASMICVMNEKTSTRKRGAVLAGGRLRIGDEWNAINIIARTQTHPLKAVCELAENALDAGAREITIMRRRAQGEIYLEIIDDGQGIARSDDGLPDFGRIATHVCDSMKRQLAEQERQGIHGEFGIGLLSFWSLGETLRMFSPGSDGKLYEMQLGRGKRTYSVRAARGSLAAGGTRVAVGPLLTATRTIVTGEKLQRYLSEELRDRIRNTGAKVRIIDRVSHKQLLVAPREFSGELLVLAPHLATQFGDVVVELYLFGEAPSAGRGVAICKDGTRVLRQITELEQFQHAPWTDGRVEGVLDYGALSLAPGTRDGIVPDERLTAFCEAVERVEPEILQEIAQRDHAESARASRDILRQVHRAFVSALRDLPSNEYLFFDLPESRPLPTGLSTVAEQQHSPGMKVPSSGLPAPANDGAAGDDQILLPLPAGPLAAVRVSPRNARRDPGAECRLSATARDGGGIAILEGVEFRWRVAEGPATVRAVEGSKCTVTAAAAGQSVVEVEAWQGEVTVTDQVPVKFLDSAGETSVDSGKGLPSYRLEPEHGQPWRSRYDVARNEIIINSAHRDFSASQVTAAKHRRYVGKLYAKEVVLINFPHQAPADILERLIELTLRTEDAL
jgi:Histidine kinase-, DNA gyrase B-, and HSP90-like ATPase